MNNQYELELQKSDLMIGIWQEITRFSDRVLTLQRNHRSSIQYMMNTQTINSHTINNNNNNNNNNHKSKSLSHNTNSNNINTHTHKPNHNNNHNSNKPNGSHKINNKKRRQKRHYRFSTGNDTSSES
eukprot:325190_1